MAIERISPASGASDAHTPLSVFARALPPHEPLECVFDDTTGAVVVAAVRVTSTLVVCAAPPSQRRETRLHLATRSHGLVSDAVVFTYEVPGALAALTPAIGEVAGGATVTIRANRFRADASLLCFFGAVPAGAVERVNSTAARVVVPAATDGPGAVVVRCMEDGVAMASSGLAFTYVSGVRVSWIAPQTGFASAATRVVVHGSGFQREYPMQCRFGDALLTVSGPTQHVFEYFVDPVLLSVSPPFGSETGDTRLVIRGANSAARVRVELHGAESKSHVVYSVTVMPRLLAIEPTVVVEAQGVDVTLTGVGFVDSPLFRCRFGASVVTPLRFVASFEPSFGFLGETTTIRISGTNIPRFVRLACHFVELGVTVRETGSGVSVRECEAPRLTQRYGMRVSIQVLEESHGSVLLEAPFRYLRKPEVARVFPGDGLDTGGTMISVFGNDFFDNSETTGRQCASHAARFEYRLLPVAKRLVPSSGHQLASTVVTVTGAGFFNASSVLCRFGCLGAVAGTFVNTSAVNPALQCRFGAKDIVRAEWISESTVSCAVPPHMPGSVNVYVTNNLLTYSETAGLFQYIADPAVLAFEPPYVSRSAISCVMPPVVGATRSVNVSVSLNGVDVEPSDFRFTYVEDAAVLAVSPTAGPVSEVSMVQLFGVGFMASPHSSCFFGSHLVPAITVPAWGIEYDKIVEPDMSNLRMANAASTVEVADDSQDFSNSEVEADFPTLLDLKCVVGELYIINASYLSDSWIECTLPVFTYATVVKIAITGDGIQAFELSGGLQSVPLSEHRNTNPDPSHGSVYLFPEAHYYPQYWSRLVALEVSNNRHDFSLDGVNFLYFKDPTLSEIYPASAYDVPELTIFARGSNFINSTALTCRLGLAVFPATFITSQLLLCIATDAHAYEDSSRDSRVRAARHAFVEISNNGKDFTSSHLVFEFLGSCPSGFYCPPELAGKKTTCPRGSFCPGHGNRNFTLCPRGTYQPRLAQAACQRCPVGYHCPHPGMHVPRICPAGFVCDVTGIEEAEQLCPEGHFCLEGTATTSTLCIPQPRTGILVASTAKGENVDNYQVQDETFDYSSTSFALRRPVPCPTGTYCHPGTAGNDLSMKNFTTPQPCFESMYCPEGSASPLGFGECAVGFYCPLCPKGFYCLEGTATSDGFRNDTRLRPYPCKPGTYCLKGVVADEVRTGDYRYAQNCTEGFYCELGSSSPKGSGLCPPGFTCPSGTAAPIPTEAGKFADLEGTVAAADCAPGYYAPTIESTTCIPCPPGTSCENDGTAVATVCGPGSYRGGLSADGISCLACPQGTWSKNWEIRGVEECIKCAPGMVCPIDGITHPCTSNDLPHVFVPLLENLSISECLEKGSAYFFGVLLEPWIDESGSGSHLLPSRDGKCYENFQPRGSVLYQRLADFHGPMYDLATGVPHQGYGDADQYPAPNLFDRGSLVIDLQVAQMYDVARNCTQGFFHKGQWFPGTCEADIFCSATSASSSEFVAQAQPCPEGYVCDLETSAERAFAHYCPGGYVCGPGTTPDLSIQSPRGQLNELCPASRYCGEGTAESQKDQSTCPAGYFCPTGTMNPYLGYIANDALRRRLPTEEANPFLRMDFTKYITEGDIRVVSAHDMHCFGGTDDDLEAIFRKVKREADGKDIVRNRAVEHDMKCARDHKWRHVELAIRRNDCDCVAQVKLVRRVFQLWKCTMTPSSPDPTIYDPNLYGWKIAHLSTRQCRFVSSDDPAGYVDLSQRLANDSKLTFRVSWTETASVASYSELKKVVAAKYKAHVADIPSKQTSADPYLYDLNYAITVIEQFGEETLQVVGFKAGTDEVLRLDACACPNLFKCPNGTMSSVGSTDIYSCVKTGSEVLQRLSPVPSAHPRLANGSDYKTLSGMNKGIGSITLQPLEVATLTINTTLISTNITYKDHYQISVYVNCKPCPPRYTCDLKSIPPLCSYPDNDNSTAFALFQACMAEKNDHGVCEQMPFFCEKRSVLLAAATGLSENKVLPGCCACERHEMPYYFEDTTLDLGFPDNKHGYLQFSIAAVERSELTIVLELLHGLYVQDFEESFTDDRFDFDIFTPSRADYTPATPSTNTFFSVIDKATYTDLMLPLNLPESRHRITGTLTFENSLEGQIFIDRLSDIMVGDPMLPAKRGFLRNKAQNTVGVLVASRDSGANSSNATESLPVVAPTNYFNLYPIADPRESVVYSDAWWTQKLSGLEFMALPYFPFFSSCRGFDSHMWIAKLLESHPDCEYVTYDETVEVNQYPWKKKTKPNADKCVLDYAVNTTLPSGKTVIESRQRGISLSCTYEENLEGGAEKPRWYEAATGTTLFYLTRDPASPDDFVAQTATGMSWGRTDVFASYVGTDNLIAVQVGKSHGLQLAVPQEVYLNLTYYQVTPGKKRLVEAEINFGRLCTVSRSSDILAKMAKKGISPCAISRATNKLASSDYELQVSLEPLDWFELMNLFQFTPDVYLVFFMLVGVMSILQGLIIWVINRLFTKMKRPPKFRMKILLKNITYPPSVGILLAVIPTTLACAFIYIWWYSFSSLAPLTDPDVVSFEGVAGDWLDQISLTQERVTKYKKGRVGVSLVAAGVYLMLLGARLMVPDTLDPQFEDNAYKEMATAPEDPFQVEEEGKEKPDENEFWEPRRWKQANLLLLTLSFVAMLLIVWEFSYSSMFTSNIYAFLVLFKVLRNVVEIVIENFLFEKLLVMPFVVVLALSESMIAMGSADFLGFTLFYFVNLSFLFIERLYFAPLLRYLWGMWPKWKLVLHRKLRKRRRRTREQKAAEEAEWRRVCEKIDNQAAGVEAVLEGVAGYCVIFTELFLTPVLLMFQVVFSEDTKMPELYGVKQTDLLYYALFSLFIIPSNLVMGVFQLNTLELAHGWKIYEYISYQKHRFATRDHRWQMRDGARDESIHPAFQSLDLLCLSSQFYFLVTLYALGILLTLYGTSVFLRYNYSIFGDVITVVILIVVTMFARALETACMRIGDRLGIWVQKQLDGTLDDEIAAKLALGPGRQKDLERERLELQALNSERFRHRFMERNRPWILQHLVELFTPRTLAATGVDGRPNSEYVRDIYHELMNMGEGRRLQGDRSDISSDSEDELEKMRRNWTNVPVGGASKDIALFWLARARKRRVFAKLVAGIIANNKQSSCAACQKSEEGGYAMHVDLANSGQTAHDSSAIDRLIDGFELEFGENEVDADLWKAFFRKRATFLTLCNVCTSALQQKQLARLVQQLHAGGRKLRDDELSSDEDDDVSFEPLVIGRVSVEGRVLSKWLIAARKKLGGVFPREHAKQEMEAYAKKMRAKKARKGKQAHVDSDEEDPSIHWKLQLNEASRAIALRWVWQARDSCYTVFVERAEQLRSSLLVMTDKMLEVDDWFYGKELRLDGVRLVEEGRELREEQTRYDEDMQAKIHQTQRDLDAFETEKREAMATEAQAFQQILAREAEDAKSRTETREVELLKLQRKKEAEFAASQQQARVEGTLTAAMVNEQRAFLARMEDERAAEITRLVAASVEREKQKRDVFERKLALVDSSVQNRRALAQHRVLSVRKEARNAVWQRESSWQARALGWMERASRKISVREQEELEAHTEEARSYTAARNVILKAVPPKLTWRCQPADVAWMKPLKDRLRARWVELLRTQLVQHEECSGLFVMTPPGRSDIAQWCILKVTAATTTHR
ncbi:hypothetical protein PybrP1_007587 [[Pythium] brassicae (nom. inval.)]|nr:hypothetical protein PybrP1_007587 [[Pythium] brassicae (nom. inval.)]